MEVERIELISSEYENVEIHLERLREANNQKDDEKFKIAFYQLSLRVGMMLGELSHLRKENSGFNPRR